MYFLTAKHETISYIYKDSTPSTILIKFIGYRESNNQKLRRDEGMKG